MSKSSIQVINVGQAFFPLAENAAADPELRLGVGVEVLVVIS